MAASSVASRQLTVDKVVFIVVSLLRKGVLHSEKEIKLLDFIAIRCRTMAKKVFIYSAITD